MPRAQYASYKTPRSGGARTCLKGTRINVLKTIDTWALYPECDHPSVFWLNGVAGIGKSTIAHTVASRLDALQQLGGSFVFLKTDDQLTDGNLVFPTLALQLSSFDPLFKSQLAQVLEDDPGCVTESPKVQFEKLIRQPLSAISISKPLILVLDALDECHPDSLEEILGVIVNSVKDIPFLRVFITSRPEGQIREGLAVKDSNSKRQRLVLHEDMHVQEEVEKDIRLYLKTSLQEIWQKENQGEWPSEKDLETLVEHSGKLFIYAATMVRFIGGNRTLDLERQLGILLSVKVGHIPVSDSYRRLDQLYLNILEAALPADLLDDPHYIERFQKVVGSIVLIQKPLPLEALARFLGDSNVPEIKRTLYHLHSIIIVPDHASDSPRAYHLSFPNFITSLRRCTNKNAYINSQTQEQYLFLRCLYIMSNFFGPVIRRKGHPKTRLVNIESLDNQAAAQGGGQPPSYVQGDSAYDFYEGDMSMTPEVRYANNHWCSHLVNIRVRSDVSKKTSEESDEALEQLIGPLEQFIGDYLSQWLDRRVGRISSIVLRGARKRKFAQDTFDIMYNAYQWMVRRYRTISKLDSLTKTLPSQAANIDSRRSQGMQESLKVDARMVFRRLFPSAPRDYHYTLGDRLNVRVLYGRRQ
jgi:hypothetical protein